MRSLSTIIDEEYMPNNDKDDRELRAAWIRQRIKRLKGDPESVDPTSSQNPREFIHHHTPHQEDQHQQEAQDGD